MNSTALIDRVAADAAVAALANSIRDWWALPTAERNDPHRRTGMGSLFRELMRHLAISQNELARTLAIDPNTVSRWVLETTAPRLNVIPRLDVLVDEVMMSRGLNALVLGNHSKPSPAFLTSDDIARRKHLAAHLWMIKWNRPFLTGRDPQLNDALDHIMRESDDSEDPRPVYHFVFPSRAVAVQVSGLRGEDDFEPYVGDHPDTAAELSFGDLRERLIAEYGELLSEKLDQVVHGHEIRTLADVLRLGIPRSDLGFFMIQYRANVRRQIGRDFDVFVEMDAPVAAEMPDPREGVFREPSRTFWVQQTQDTALAMKRRWWPILSAICERDTRERSAREAAERDADAKSGAQRKRVDA